MSETLEEIREKKKAEIRRKIIGMAIMRYIKESNDDLHIHYSKE